MSVQNYRDRQKSVIISAAREILKTEGLEGLQARRVASDSDCSVGTIYNLFGSLDMLIIAANAGTLNDLHAVLLRARSRANAVNEQLDALSKAYLDFALARTNEWRALFEHRLTTKTPVPEWYRENQAELFEIVEELLAPAIQSEQRRSESARALFSAVHGVISLALDQKLGDFDRGATERQVSFIIRSISRGLTENQPAEPLSV